MPKCDRCGAEATTTTGSYFNTDTICMECDKIERAHPKFRKAIDTEHEAVKGGDLNYPGIGLPEDYEDHAAAWKLENKIND